MNLFIMKGFFVVFFLRKSGSGSFGKDTGLRSLINDSIDSYESDKIIRGGGSALVPKMICTLLGFKGLDGSYLG